METKDKSNPQYSNPHAEDQADKKKDMEAKGDGPFHEHPSEDPQVQKRNEGHLTVDDDPERANEKLLEDNAGAYLLDDTAVDERDNQASEDEESAT